MDDRIHRGREGMRDGPLIAALFSVAFVCLWIGFIVGGSVAMIDKVPERQAIEHGHAYYHPETGAFTWRDREATSE